MLEQRLKLAMVHSKSLSEWVSCQSISTNLLAAYKVAFPKADIVSFNLSPEMPQLLIWEEARKIQHFAPDFIIIIDHKPHPRELLKAVYDLCTPQKFPPLIIHLFGDFALYARDWLRFHQELPEIRLRFVGASHKQQQFVSQFFLGEQEWVDYCPFPVDPTKFFFDQDIRQTWRNVLGLSTEEFAFIYTGRLTLQKNITFLIEQFARFTEKSSIPCKLFLAGSFDDLGAPYFGVEYLDGHYFQICLKLLEKLPQKLQEKIQFLGPLETSELNGVLNAADSFISLSLHNDEDFGMSPIEALCTGLPTVLTDWGGYSSFALDEQCKLVPTEFDSNGVVIDLDYLENEMIKLSQSNKSLEKRKATGQFYSAHFSISSVGPLLQKLIKRTPSSFVGFGQKMELLSAIIKKEVPFEFGHKRGSFYQEIYSLYAGTLNKVYDGDPVKVSENSLNPSQVECLQ